MIKFYYIINLSLITILLFNSSPMTELIFEEDEFEYQYNDFLQVNLRKGINVLKHQQKTLDFMDYRSRSKIISGGIIALKMGLGKTCISLFRIVLKCLRKKELIKLPMLNNKNQQTHDQNNSTIFSRYYTSIFSCITKISNFSLETRNRKICWRSIEIFNIS